jgi:hypothetical protein
LAYASCEDNSTAVKIQEAKQCERVRVYGHVVGGSLPGEREAPLFLTQEPLDDRREQLLGGKGDL